MHPKGAQNPIKIDLKTISHKARSSPTKLAQDPQNEGQKGPKIQVKIGSKTTLKIGFDFASILKRLKAQNKPKIMVFSKLFPEGEFCKNRAPVEAKR